MSLECQHQPVNTYVRLGIGSQTDRRKGPDFHRKPPSTTDSIRSSGKKPNNIKMRLTYRINHLHKRL